MDEKHTENIRSKKPIDSPLTGDCRLSSRGISTNVMGKMAKGQNITVDMLARICVVLGCTFDDVVEILPDDKEPAE